jgi:hypothetical protein
VAGRHKRPQSVSQRKTKVKTIKNLFSDSFNEKPRSKSGEKERFLEN